MQHAHHTASPRLFSQAEHESDIRLPENCPKCRYYKLHASLLEEHGSTLASLRTLDSTNASLSDLLSSSTTELNQLKETVQELGGAARKADTRTLAQKEKRLLRLQQVSKSAEFRDVITSILSVKLAFYPNGQVRLASIFDLDASFVFQSTSSCGNGGSGVGGNNVKIQLVAQGEGGPQDLPSMM
ncbi:hypothetical protein AGABI1DRAFT_132427 [Agaricus bisporus var. burnettii JB137-S8]|uniref:Uncharacterized protein n=1 Tax=Agaricus bisporus var. burnettii (strain JB137-S8 / ATCC MYA-4627 / FGSC 10392) TaxID=597362 RepID=K5XL89_AGABU|nr:uncharacterized protein AGABI1DRAFT_132427 [Agaricus bisporus var. burnettii JB137-S8]EKM75290.1 hypothetical protein AGABI1DRAFT_132427 [Agaricus bisporus var. burnettii JB137-S8]